MNSYNAPGDLTDRLSELGVEPAEQRRLALPNFDHFPTAREVGHHAFTHPAMSIQGGNKFNHADSRTVGAWLLIYKGGRRKEVLLDYANRYQDDPGVLIWDQAEREWTEFTGQEKVLRAIPLLPRRG